MEVDSQVWTGLRGTPITALLVPSEACGTQQKGLDRSPSNAAKPLQISLCHHHLIPNLWQRVFPETLRGAVPLMALKCDKYT